MPLRLIIPTNDPDRTRLIEDYFTTSRVVLGDQVRNDKELALTIEPVTVNSVGSETLYSPDHEATDSYQIALGLPDESPESGTFTLTAAEGTTTPALAYNVSRATLETELGTIFAAESEAEPDVTEISTGLFLLVGSANGAIAAGFLTGDSANLFPESDIFIIEEDLGSVSTPYRILLTLRQAPMALANPSTQLPATGVSTADVQAQSATANRIQRISFTQPDTYGGRFSATISVGGQLVSVTATPTMEADEFGALLTAHPLVNFNRPNFDDNVAVERLIADDRTVSFVVSWIGNLAPQTIISSSVESGATTIVTTAGDHGYTSGQSVTIAGSNTTPTLDGARVVTVLSDTTFSIPVDVTIAGTTGTVRPTSAPGLTVVDIDLVGPQGVSGELSLNTIAIFKYSRTQTADTFNLLVSVTRTRASGERRTIFGPTVITLAKDIVDPSSVVPAPLADYYTSAEVDTLLTAYDRHKAFYKAASTARTSTASPVADPDLVIPVGANEVWQFDFVVLVSTASSTPDWKGGLTFPTAFSQADWEYELVDYDTETFTVGGLNNGNNSGLSIPVEAGASIRMHGVLINGANAGNISLLWSQNTSNASATTVLRGSYAKAVKMN